MYYTYVLRSSVDSKLYIGSTDNLKRRLKEHSGGKVISTRFRRPLDLIYFEACLDFSKARKRERYFKTGYGRRYLKDRI